MAFGVHPGLSGIHRQTSPDVTPSFSLCVFAATHHCVCACARSGGDCAGGPAGGGRRGACEWAWALTACLPLFFFGAPVPAPRAWASFPSSSLSTSVRVELDGKQWEPYNRRHRRYAYTRARESMAVWHEAQHTEGPVQRRTHAQIHASTYAKGRMKGLSPLSLAPCLPSPFPECPLSPHPAPPRPFSPTGAHDGHQCVSSRCRSCHAPAERVKHYGD